MDTDLDWISHQELTRITGAHPTTVRRWKRTARASGRLPPWLALIVAAYRGMLEALHPAWAGWLINRRDGELVSPDGVCVTPGQVLAASYLRALCGEQAAELARLKADLAALARTAGLAAARGPRCRLMVQVHEPARTGFTRRVRGSDVGEGDGRVAVSHDHFPA